MGVYTCAGEQLVYVCVCNIKSRESQATSGRHMAVFVILSQWESMW